MKGAAGIASLAATPALAQTSSWPSRLLKTVVPLPPGGVMDGLTRIVADRLAQRLGQAAIVENKPGANGMIATSAVAGADPDGYTILSTMSSIVQNVSLHKSPNYKMSDLLPLAPLGRLPIAFIVPRTLGVTLVRLTCEALAVRVKDSGEVTTLDAYTRTYQVPGAAWEAVSVRDDD